jgi:RNA polymerase sigma-70 factor (ECF subfamily)
VITLNRAVAISKVRGPAEALAVIEPLAEQLSNYFYFFGVRGALLLELGRQAEARTSFDRAIALAHSPEEAVHIRMQIDRLTKRRESAGQDVRRRTAKKW